MIIHEGQMSDEAMLEHFGIKGMKWGQRKAEGSSESSGGSPAPKKPWSMKKKIGVGALIAVGIAATSRGSFVKRTVSPIELHDRRLARGRAAADRIFNGMKAAKIGKPVDLMFN